MLSKQALDEFKAIWKKEFGQDITDDVATEEAINLLTLFNAVYRPIKKEWVFEFEYPEDKKFYANLLTDGDEQKLVDDYAEYFDFRAPEVKRREFNKLRKSILPILLKRDNGKCQLHFDDCEEDQHLVVDHLIPLSSNKLNRKLRGERTTNGKKPKTQSFGSNHLKNLVIACEHCNSWKKHRIFNPKTRELI